MDSKIQIIFLEYFFHLPCFVSIEKFAFIEILLFVGKFLNELKKKKDKILYGWSHFYLNKHFFLKS